MSKVPMDKVRFLACGCQTKTEQISEVIFCALRNVGIQVATIMQSQEYPDKISQYQTWLNHGYHGSMQYLERHIHAKFSPQNILPGCQSLIIVAMNYYQPNPVHQTLQAGYGKISKYAWGRDYHKTLGYRLREVCNLLRLFFPEQKWICATDATPLDERYYAFQAGLGVIAGNTLLVTPYFGSWCFLGEILTTLLLPPSPPTWLGTLQSAPPLISDKSGPMTLQSASPLISDKSGPMTLQSAPPLISDKSGPMTLQSALPLISDKSGPMTSDQVMERCNSCRRCIKACPTGALISLYHKDSSLCLSYLTIENRGLIPPELHDKLGTWLFGCDICQEICPYNYVATQPTTELDFTNWKTGDFQYLEDIFKITNESLFQSRYSGSPLMRAKYFGIIRNAMIVATNSGYQEFLPQLQQLQYNNDPIIAQTAIISLQRFHHL